MSQTKGCASCVGNLIFIFFISSLLFSGLKCSVGFGNFSIGFGSWIRQNENLTNLTELESQKKIVEEAVKIFHSQLNQGQCGKIHQQASEAFKQYIRQYEFQDWCENLRNQLGTVKSSQLVTWNAQAAENYSSNYIVILYNTNFSNFSSPVQTAFIWRVENGKAELYGYNVNPDDLKQNSKINQL